MNYPGQQIPIIFLETLVLVFS